MNYHEIAIAEPPHVPMMEKSVLSILMQWPEKLHDQNGTRLCVEHFYQPGRRLIFEEVSKEIHETGGFDLTGFISQMVAKNMVDRMGGVADIADCHSYATFENVFKSHVEALTESMARRLAIRAGMELARSAFEDETVDMLRAAGSPITAIHEAFTSSAQAPDIKTLSTDFLANFEKLLRGEKSPMGIPSGIAEVDQRLKGFHSGMMGVISARSSGGKSTLATQMMCGTASPDSPVLYVPLEGTIAHAYTRCVIQLSRLPAEAITNPLAFARSDGREMLTKLELQEIRSAYATIKSGGFHFDQPRNRRVATILTSIRRAHQKHGIKVAFIDYLQLIEGESDRSKEQELTAVSHKIQGLATELGITIVAMSQENDGGETKHARTIEEDADWWLSIVQHRDREKENFQQHRHILISKDRHYSQGGVRLPLVLDRAHVRFVYGLEPSPKAPEKNGRFAK